MSKAALYPIHEMFYTFQGEGCFMGCAAYFVRFMGCDQRCHFCDSAGTWHKDWMPDNVEKLTAKEIVHRVIVAGISIDTPIILTGGEPALQNLEPLLDLLHFYGFKAHIETAGHRPLPVNMLDWITVSPKTFSIPPLEENINAANEIKIIVESEAGMERDLALCGNTKGSIWLHPEWSKRHDPEILNLITETVKRSGDPRIRAGYQMHKLYCADTLDEGASKVLSPLGGVLSNGRSN